MKTYIKQFNPNSHILLFLNMLNIFIKQIYLYINHIFIIKFSLIINCNKNKLSFHPFSIKLITLQYIFIFVLRL